MSSPKEDDPEDDVSRIDFKEFCKFFNRERKRRKTETLIPKVATVSKRRKTAILSRCSEHGEVALVRVVKKAIASDFLNGKNNREWVADFDWLMRPNNFPKVLDGNYDNKNVPKFLTAEERRRQKMEEDAKWALEMFG